MRGPTRRQLIRSLLDIRLSRLSLFVLAGLSAVATIVIISSGQSRTPAQIAALAALRERPVTVREIQTQPAPTSTGSVSTPSSASAATSSASASSDSSGSSPAPTSSASPVSSSGSGSSGTSSAGTSTPSPTSATASAATKLPKVGHVFEIALSTTGYAAVFGHGSAAPYLRSLEAKGTLLTHYESLGRGELADYLAMVSGQGPNADTSVGCTSYVEFPQAVAARANGLVPGRGCVYPETALTIGDQVSSSGHVWKAYIADMGNQACSHPNSDAVDDVALSGTEPGYDTRHNPFIYFHSLLDLGDCANNDVDLSKLPSALAKKSRTATFSFIAPGACQDARATVSAPSPATAPASSTSTTTTSAASTASTTASSTTASSTTSATTSATSGSVSTPVTAAGCPSGQPVGIPAEDVFLKLWVPRILSSPAYKKDGVLVITFAGAGRKRAGALVLSRWARKGKAIATVYRPYSVLRSVEDMLGYTALAHAQSAPTFASAVLHKTM